MDICLKGVKKSFTQGNKKLSVLQNINVCFAQGKRYAITGFSGTGKSTLLHIIAGLDEPTEGMVLFGGRDIDSYTSTEKSQFLHASLGFVFQSPYLIKELSVVENVMVPGLIAGEQIVECKKRSLDLLEAVGITEKAECLPSSLSGGQQQRVAIARAMFNQPSFLIADEPTGNLDVLTGKRIVDLLLACSIKWNMGMIISSHDAYVAEKMEHVYKIGNGILIEI